MRENVTRRCEELALTKEETDLVLDLLGWNIRETKKNPPLSHRGLRIYSSLDWYEPDTAEKIKALCEKLLGPNLEAVRKDPYAFFYEHYTHKVASRGVGTLLQQLEIKSPTVDYSSLVYFAPEVIYPSFVRIMAFLLTCNKNDATRTSLS